MEEYTNYLAHHGVKGMKWGVRRYQNADGSLTGKGRSHYGIKSKRKDKIKKGLKIAGAGAAVAGAAGAAAVGATVGSSYSKTKKAWKYDNNNAKSSTEKSSMFERNIKRGKDKEKISPAEQFTKESSNTINNVKDAYKAAKRAYKSAEIEEAKAKQMKEIKSMPDDELRKRINRLELEKRYVNLSSPSYGEGRDRVEDVLDILGPIAGIAGSAAIVGSTIYKFKGGK